MTVRVDIKLLAIRYPILNLQVLARIGRDTVHSVLDSRRQVLARMTMHFVISISFSIPSWRKNRLPIGERLARLHVMKW